MGEPSRARLAAGFAAVGLLILVVAGVAPDAFGDVDGLVGDDVSDVVGEPREFADGALDAVPRAWVRKLAIFAGQAVISVVVLAWLGTLVVGDERVGGALFAAVGFGAADLVLVLPGKAGLALFHDADEDRSGGAVFAVFQAVVVLVVVAGFQIVAPGGAGLTRNAVVQVDLGLKAADRADGAVERGDGSEFPACRARPRVPTPQAARSASAGARAGQPRALHVRSLWWWIRVGQKTCGQMHFLIPLIHLHPTMHLDQAKDLSFHLFHPLH